MGQKILIVRFSSLGDIAQALTTAACIKSQWPNAQIDWLVREDLVDLVRLSPHINQIHSLNRRSGLSGLWQLCKTLAHMRYTHVYDAHNSLRSNFVYLLLRFFYFQKFRWLQRPKNRFRRFLQFRVHIQAFAQPTVGVITYLWPLRKWGLTPWVSKEIPIYTIDLKPEPNRIGLIPSAAWELKRWPIKKFVSLIQRFPNFNFTVFGGPEDRFCETLKQIAPDRVENLAGQLSLRESYLNLARMSMVVGNDTGLTHVADGLGLPLIMLVGPSAFGYPFRPYSRVAELDLKCKPCSKDGRTPCKNKEWQKCLQDLSVETVAQHMTTLAEVSK